MSEETVSPCLEVTRTVADSGGKDMHKCMQCGLCAGLCPWRSVESPFSLRQVVHQLQLGVEGFESDDILFGCTQCRMCENNCPRGVATSAVVRAARAVLYQSGALPRTVSAALGNVRVEGNPMSGNRDARLDWTKKLDQPLAVEGDTAMFSCCVSSFDPRGQKSHRALTDVLRAVEPKISGFGPELSCCGGTLRAVGADDLFSELSEANRKVFEARGLKTLVVDSPHVYDSLLHDYFGEDQPPPFQIKHYTEFLAERLASGTLQMKTPFPKKVTYHDPCYLGKINNVFEPPRQLLRAVPGLELVEMPRNRFESLCCGGGGGRMWMETPADRRFGVLRVKEALATGAEVIATSCPYCVSMFEDGRIVLEAEEKIQVMDLSEIVRAAL
ncbi:MAG: (Fe-S)-binding protein [Deltaproteobacteria bacterium]|nr:(Fe-S)-binding protein [Deltaproteobacteria bacterium]